MSRIAIDSNWVGLRNWFATGKTQDPNRLMVSILQSILKVIKTDEYKSQVYMLWDGGRDRYRGHDATYKSGREYNEEFQVVWDTLKNLQELLPLLGIHSIRAPGVEADDLGFYYSYKAVEEDIFTMLIALDRDWILSVNHKTLIHRPAIQKAPEEFLDVLKVCEQFGLDDHKDFLVYKAINGDGSDSIPGVGCNMPLKEAIVAYYQKAHPEDIQERLESNVRLMRVDHIVTDLEVHNWIKECELKTTLSTSVPDVLTKHVGTFPPYFLGVLGKYQRTRKQDLLKAAGIL